MRKKRILALLMALLLVFSISTSVLAVDTNDKEKELENQLDNSEEKIDGLKGSISDLKDKILSSQKQAKTLETNILKVDGEIRAMMQKITGVQNKVDVASKELDAAIEDYNLQDARMKKRINALYKNGTTTGYLEVILESKSFADFMSKADILQKIVNYDVDMLKEMKQKREEINKKKVLLEKDKAELVVLKNNLDANKKTLVKQNQDKKTIIAQLGRDKASYESILSQEEATAAKIKGEINALRSYRGNFDGSKWAILHISDFPSGVTPRISSYFGYRTDPITGSKAYHSGLDISTRGYNNIPVYAMAGGKVIVSKYYGTYGNTVVIDHGSGVTTLYAHNTSLVVSVGAMVKGGQKIANSGTTGRSTGPHVHFGVQIYGEYVDPANYYLLGD